MIYYPIFTKETIMLAASMSAETYDALLVLTILMAHRAQISSASTGLLQKDKVLQLESTKWNSKQLANLPILKKLYAQLALASTLQFEAAELINLSEVEAGAHLENVADALSKETKPKNARVLTNASLKASNIQIHRHGKIAQAIGLVQARPIFEPQNVFRGVAVSNLTFPQLMELFLDTMEKLEIKPKIGSRWQHVNRVDFGEQNVLPATEAAIYVLTPHLGNILEVTGSEDGTKSTFADGVNFGTQDNLLPLERKLFKIDRPIGTTISNIKIENLNEQQKANPFLIASIKLQEEQASNVRGVNLPVKPKYKVNTQPTPPDTRQRRKRKKS